jgi:8-oxo-dGTP diphosphatase
MLTPPRFGNYQPEVRYRKRPGAYALLLNEQGLLGRVELPQGYFLPGGGIETGETPENAVLREIAEETAFQAQLLFKIGEASEYLYTPGYSSGMHKPSSFFVAEITGSTGQTAEHPIDWVSPAILHQTLLHHSQRWAVEQFMPYFAP